MKISDCKDSNNELKTQQAKAAQTGGTDYSLQAQGESKSSDNKAADHPQEASLQSKGKELPVAQDTVAKTRNAKRSRFWKIFNVVGGVLLVAFTLLILISAFSAKINNKPMYILGYTFSIVVTDSMSPEINVGDFVVSKKTDIEDVKVGDNVLFTCLSGALEGQNIIHRAVSVNSDGSIVTKGVKEGATVDDLAVTADNLVGRQVWQSAVIGSIIMFFSSVTNWMFIVVIAVTVVFIIKIVKKLILTIKSGD